MTRKHIWADVDFIRRINNIKAECLRKGKMISTQKITKDIANSQYFNQIEKEMTDAEQQFIRYER